MTDRRLTPRRYWLGGNRDRSQDIFFEEALDQGVWQAGDASDWDSCWYTGMPKPEVFDALTPGKTINHIPGNNSLTIKSNLHATLAQAHERMAEQAGADHELTRRLGFFPRTFSVPHDYHTFQQAALDAPEQWWILKPKNASKGKDISLLDDPALAPLESKWMVQEYLHRPHTINGHKYVLRLYVVVTSVVPLRVYLYHQGSAKLASEVYDPAARDNRFAHLTNPDVNATNTASASPVVFLDFERYRAWLREQGHDDEVLFSRIRDMLTLTIIAAREKMVARTRRVAADTTGCYELLGIDCLVDADLNPWILECNLSPSMDVCAAPEDGGDVEAANKRQLVADMVAMLNLNGVDEDLTSLDPGERIEAEAQRELARAGGFSRLFPCTDAGRYLPYFPCPRLEDMLLADAVTGEPVPRPRLRARQTVEMISEDGLALYSGRNNELYTPNAAASWIWLQATEGHDPDTVAGMLAATQQENGIRVDPWSIRKQVWEILADWADSGLLIQADDEVGGEVAGDAERLAVEEDRQAWRWQVTIQAGVRTWHLQTSARPVASRLSDLIAPIESTAVDAQGRIDVLQAARGYAIAVNGAVVASGLSLAHVAPRVFETLCHYATDAEDVVVARAAVVPLGAAPPGDLCPAVLSLRDAATGSDTLAVELATHLGYGCSHGALLSLSEPARMSGLGMPARMIGELDGEDAKSGLHEWAGGQRGQLLPAQGHSALASYRIVAVVVPESGTPAAGEASAHRLVPERALAHLVPLTTAASGQALRPHQALALRDWLSSRPCIALRQAGATVVLESILTEAGMTPPVSSDV
ncbi:hypothetical protein [Aquisalimonas sp.]|uniref:hypothetical protein n=1 Tax=Aquisalimonas sp. TaxID=1872621 RepID=UPI0025C065F5|nr:hypothetical protein [Aquisalimonas sp.]